MSREKDLISIGEISKLTGASVVSLRYYEKLGILIPAYISPDSGYRYYSFDQIQLAKVIKFCIELNIPLKEFAKFANADNAIDFRTFLEHGSKIAEQKMKALKRGLGLIDDIKQQIDLTNSYQTGQVYERRLPKAFYYVKPLGTSLKGLDRLEISIAFSNEVEKTFSEQPYSEDDHINVLKYGLLCEHTQSETMYYAFFEVAKHMKNKPTKTIPAGMYMCIQSEESQIGRTTEIFSEYLADKGSYLAIENEVFSDKHEINKPLNELKVIRLQ